MMRLYQLIMWQLYHLDFSSNCDNINFFQWPKLRFLETCPLSPYDVVLIAGPLDEAETEGKDSFCMKIIGL